MNIYFGNLALNSRWWTYSGKSAEGEAALALVAGYIGRRYARPKTVNHPSTRSSHSTINLR